MRFLLKAFGVLVEVGLQVFFWLTLTFAILERSDKGKDMEPLTMNHSKWTPEDLKSVTYIPKKKEIPRGEVFCSLIWTAIWATCLFLRKSSFRNLQK